LPQQRVLGLGADVAHSTRHVVVENVEVRLHRLPHALDGLRVAQLSDFHYDRYVDNHIISAAVTRTNELQPDLVVLTGDFVTQRFLTRRDPEAAHNVEPCGRLLGELKSRLGTLAVLGNHDYYTDANFVAEALNDCGIRVLRNQAWPIEQNEARLWIIGVDDVLFGGDDLGTALKGVPRLEPKLLLAHEPDYADWVPQGVIDFQLSGHSHGGQIRFPFVGPLYLPPLARKYPLGLRQLGMLTLYTNRGVGTIRIPARWNCPPEVTLFTLRAGG
jgi:predicted MPP superfamily phosphohydrolase